MIYMAYLYGFLIGFFTCIGYNRFTRRLGSYMDERDAKEVEFKDMFDDD